MTPLVSVAVIAAAFATATLSGIFGIAGGLILMGVLALLLPVTAAFVTQGLLQMVANGWRVIVHHRHVQWRIVVLCAVGSAMAGAIVAAVAFTPSKPLLYLMLGLVPALIWLPQGRFGLDAARTLPALTCGLIVTTLNLTAGAAGPLLDIFFVRTVLNRHQIVATKAATQVFSHLAKVIVFGGMLLKSRAAGMPPAWVFALAVPVSMAGTILGGRILDRMSDVNFKRWTRWIVTAIGVGYLLRAAQLFAE